VKLLRLGQVMIAMQSTETYSERIYIA